jgi:hypothetical protein
MRAIVRAVVARRIIAGSIRVAVVGSVGTPVVGGIRVAVGSAAIAIAVAVAMCRRRSATQKRRGDYPGDEYEPVHVVLLSEADFTQMPST